ncbi:hypothetical protein AGMMS49960_14760 [Betaproteobacteria bacterium]|nr:hypothetical protein AGMMS49543_22610 [Betaproteobacteria bacterium]GHU02460.1 hypothetical protein AGMMS49960_14760 [Betaproteobacteria bacterium]GHU22252.1 hypothetical protein AGMMS50243_21480 [Betaproteobacteria bacterium]
MFVFAVSAILLFFVGLIISQRLRAFMAFHRLICVVVLLVLAGLFVFVLMGYFSVAACLDRGGRWDKERAVCLN